MCLFVLLKDLSQSEISQADVTIFLHEDVLWFQISVDNLLLVEMTESQGDCKRIKLSSLFSELPRFSQVHEKLTTTDKLHDEKDLHVSLENELHTNEEWMIGLLQDIFLEHSRLNLIVIQNDIFSQGFHSVDCLGILLLDQKDFSETTLSNDLNDLEGIKTSWCLILFQASLENGVCTHFSEFLIGLINLCSVHILLWGKLNGFFLLLSGSGSILGINVFFFDSCVFIGLHFFIFLDISLFCGKLINTFLNSVDWQIFLLKIPIIVFDLLENLVP